MFVCLGKNDEDVNCFSQYCDCDIFRSENSCLDKYMATQPSHFVFATFWQFKTNKPFAWYLVCFKCQKWNRTKLVELEPWVETWLDC